MAETGELSRVGGLQYRSFPICPNNAGKGVGLGNAHNAVSLARPFASRISLYTTTTQLSAQVSATA
jgi:hypothetical protein